MHRCIGLRALAVSLSLAAGSAWAQSPQSPPGQFPHDRPLAGEPVPRGAVEERGEFGGAVIPVTHDTHCNFDPVEQFNDERAGALDPSISQRVRHKHFGRLARPDEDYCNFECANCWSWADVEKRFIFSYAIAGPQGFATEAGYGGYNSGQFGIEVLPWVLRDSPNNYTRWGGTAFFHYASYIPFDQSVITSQLSGRQLTVHDGNTYSLIVGPTLRTDFEVGHVRLSPNFTGGLSFDWTTMHGEFPSNNAHLFREVQQFHMGGFDVGGYFRWMLDFALTDYLYLSMGVEYKFSPTDILVRNDEIRKHTGFVIGFSHEF